MSNSRVGNQFYVNTEMLTNKSTKGLNLHDRVVEKFKNYTRKDIARWRSAMIAAEGITKDRQVLLDVYSDIILDAHLSSQVDQRCLRIAGMKWKVVNENKEINEEMMGLLDTKWFHDFMRFSVLTKFWGFKVLEIAEIRQGQIFSLKDLPMKNLNLMLNLVELTVGSRTGVSWDEGRNAPWLLPIGETEDLGLLMKAAPLVLYKKAVLANWSQYTELFGQPIRIAKTASRESKRKSELANTLHKMGSAAYGVFEEGETIELIETNKTGGWEVYDKLIDRANSELSKLIVGQTMTADDGSSRSQSEVHENMFDDITQSDRTDMKHIINSQLFPALQVHGYPTEGAKWMFDNERKMDLKERWTITEGILRTYNVDEAWIEDTFEIPIIGKKAPIVPPLGGGLPPEPGNPKPIPGKPDIEPNARIEFPNIMCGNHYDYRDMTIVMAEGITSDEKALLRKVFDKDPLKLDPKSWTKTRNRLTSGLLTGFGGVSNDIASQDHVALRAMQMNVNRFGFDKSLTQIAGLNKLIQDQNITSFRDFEKKASKLLNGYNRNFLETEYNFAIATGQNARAWMDIRQDFQFWKYSTVGDSHVRRAHANLDGRVFSVDDASAAKLFPPNGYGCRCLGTGVTTGTKVSNLDEMKLAMGESEFQMMQNKGFLFNRGDTREIFHANQFYSRELKADIIDVASATFQVYGKRGYAALAKGRKEFEMLDVTTTEVRSFFKDRIKDTGVLFTDFDGLPVFMDVEDFNNNRTGLMVSLDEALKSPNEAWLLPDGDNGKITYMSFFKNGAVQTTASFSKDTSAVIISAEFVDTDAVNQFRKGILIKDK